MTTVRDGHSMLGTPHPSQNWIRVQRVFGYLIHRDSFLALGAMALFQGILDWLGRLPGALPALAHPLSSLAFAGYFVLVANKAALGDRRLPTFMDIMDTWDLLMLPLTRATLATLWCWTALALWLTRALGFNGAMEAMLTNPMDLLVGQGLGGNLMFLLGLMALPLCMLAALAHRSILRQLDPSLGLRLACRVATPFLFTFIALHLFGWVNIVLSASASLAQNAIPIPLASTVMAYFVRLWMPLAQARLMGEFVWDHRTLLTMP